MTDYKLRVLPLFEKDLEEIIDYISINLKNPLAAENLLNDVENEIRKRIEYPKAFEEYHSAREREHPYYRIYVKNYIIFYVVIDNIMEVRRIIYKRQESLL